MISLRWPLMIGFAVLGVFFVARQFPSTDVVRRAAEAVHAAYPSLTAARWSDVLNDLVNHPDRHPAALVHQLQAGLGADWAGKLPLVSFTGTVNPEQNLPAVLLNVIPSGLKGLIVVAMFAAMLSCKNGLVNGACAYFTKDIYQHFLRPRASNAELIGASYAATLAIVIGAFLIGVAASSINDLWGWIAMGLLAGQLAPGLLRLYWWRCNAWGCVGGLVLGCAGAITQRLVLPGLPEVQQFIFATVLSFAGTIIASLLTAPTPMPVLRAFYRTTRPFGWWGPLRDEVTGEARVAMDLENRNDILTVPFTLLWQVTLFLSPMMLIIKNYSAFWCLLPLFLLGAVGMYAFWWRPLQARGPGDQPLPREPDPGPAA